MRWFPVIFWLACSTAYGQATAIIEGPQQVAPGDLVILDASKSQADSLVWTLANSDKSFLQFEGGRKCVFASGAAGTYTFVLSAAKSAESGPASVAATKFVLVVGSTPTPNPQPLPGPTPGPGPNVPPPQPPLSTIALGALNSARASNRKPSEAAAIADDFERIASQGAGLSWTVPQMQTELKKTRLITDADINARWQPFRDWFRTQASSMQTPEGTRDVFTEIAAGLRAVDVKAEAVPVGDATNESLKGRIKNINGILDEIVNEVGN